MTARAPLKADSDCSKILAHLVSGRTITSWQAIRAWQCTRLSGRILDLKRRGHRIDTDYPVIGGTRIAIYRLHR